MRKLSVKSLPIDEVIRDLADELNIDYRCECDEYYIEIPEKIGQGFIHGIMFDMGIGIINYELELKDNMEVHFVKNDVHPVKNIFCYEGELVHCFAGEEDNKHGIDTYQNAIVASERKNGHILFFPKNTRIKFNSLEINREKFGKKFDCPLENLPKQLRDLFSDTKAQQEFYYIGHYSTSISDIIYRMHGYEGNKFLRRVFVESKGLEMFTLQLEQYIDDLNEDFKKSVFRKNEIEAVLKAATYLKDNIEKYTTVSDLAQKVGLNENKLQAGFKYLYNDTVNSFIQSYRLEEASRLLLVSDHNVNEISDLVGITSKSYFSKTFKEKFGMSPKAYQMKYGMSK